jgi:hypothetical protein
MFAIPYHNGPKDQQNNKHIDENYEAQTLFRLDMLLYQTCVMDTTLILMNYDYIELYYFLKIYRCQHVYVFVHESVT